MSDVLYEITALSEKDCFCVTERHKNEFTYPIHCHKEYELNFVQYGAGVRRVVGDSIEEIGDYDLVLIAGENLEHVWEQGSCKSTDIREITIQFPPDLLGEKLMAKNQFALIQKMLSKGEHGVVFPTDAIMKVYNRLDELTSQTDSFLQMLELLRILYELSKSDYRSLASSSFSKASRDQESLRIKQMKQYINDHYNEDLSLTKLSEMVGMSPSSFSRFFKQSAHCTLSGYINDIRLGMAARALVDSRQSISEICYSCGFNNLSNFNRAFKAKRGVSPKDFRQIYHKNKVVI